MCLLESLFDNINAFCACECTNRLGLRDDQYVYIARPKVVCNEHEGDELTERQDTDRRAEGIETNTSRNANDDRHSHSFVTELGLSFIGVNNRAYVRTVEKNSDAARAGVKPKDSVVYAFVHHQEMVYQQNEEDGLCCSSFECMDDDFFMPCGDGNDHERIEQDGLLAGKTTPKEDDNVFIKHAMHCVALGLRTSYSELCGLLPFDISSLSRPFLGQVVYHGQNGTTATGLNNKTEKCLLLEMEPLTTTSDTCSITVCSTDDHTTGDNSCDWSDTSHLKRLVSRERHKFGQTGDLHSLMTVNAAGEVVVRPVVIVLRRSRERQRVVCPCEREYMNIPFFEFFSLSIEAFLSS